MSIQDHHIAEKIRKLKKEKSAVILAHYYQIPEIQDIADFIGDSLALAQSALTIDARMIVFAGVHFMAETAKILNPGKKVVVPDLEAGCSLADSCPPDQFGEFLNRYPEHKVVSYINCSAAVKAMSDVICTSSNAVKIVESYPRGQKLIFAPDKNLGSYVNKITGRDMVLWNGTCHVHDLISTETVIRMKTEHPDARLIAHPECQAVILEMADFVGSTTALLNFTRQDSAEKFIVATETGIVHQMQLNSPDKEFLVVPIEESCACNDCPYMKMNTMQKLYLALNFELNEIVLDEGLMDKARVPIMKMLELSA